MVLVIAVKMHFRGRLQTVTLEIPGQKLSFFKFINMTKDLRRVSLTNNKIWNSSMKNVIDSIIHVVIIWSSRMSKSGIKFYTSLSAMAEP